MTEKTLNNCFFLYVHKDLTDELDLVYIAKEYSFKLQMNALNILKTFKDYSIFFK